MSRAADRMHAALTYASDETVHDLYRKYANDETVHDLYRNSGSASLSVYWRADHGARYPPSKRILVTNEVKLYADMLTLARRGVADIIVPPDSPKHEFSTIDEFVRCGSAVGA